MSDVAVEVEGLGKRYRIGAPQEPYGTLRDTLASAARAPLRRLLGRPSERSDFWALRDVSFEVERGEVLGIIGRNGAGKSTLLKILSRITEPTTGRAELRGRVGSLLEVGTGFHPELTGRENIYLNGAVLGMTKRDIVHHFDAIVEFADVQQFLDTPVKRYSSGMYTRLAFSVAAHLEPDVLIVDEVLSVGDVEFQKKSLGKMGEVAREGRTVFFVTHHMPAALNLCSRVALIERGILQEIGDPSRVVDAYLESSFSVDGAVVIKTPAEQTSPDIVFLRARVIDASGMPNGYVRLADGATVEFDFEVHRSIKGAQIAFELWSDDGVCVLCSTDHDADPAAALRRIKSPGVYTANCCIPAAYLRPGKYWLDLSSSIPNVRELAIAPHAISFEVTEPGDSLEQQLAQGRRGVVAPRLPWQIDVIGLEYKEC